VTEADQRCREDADADHDPERLPASVLRIEARDRGQPDRRHQRREWQQGSVRVRGSAPYDDVGEEVEAREDHSVPGSPIGDLDRDRRERRARDPGGEEERPELAIAGGHCLIPQ
jgi:hypothetical protein